MKKIKKLIKQAKSPKKKKDLTKLVKVKVRVKKGKKAGTVTTVYRKREEDKRQDEQEKEKGQSQKTLDLDKFDYKSTEPDISDFKKDKSLLSKYYYQVPFIGSNGKRQWKLYLNAKSYRKDFPDGPKKGHLLVNQAHPDHLEVNPKAIFATVGKKKYKTAAAFMNDIKVPTPAELKRKFAGLNDDQKKGFAGEIKPDFHHIEWQPGSKIFNANQRFWMGVQDAYTAYREPLQMKYDRERFQRAGVPWTEQDYRARLQIVNQAAGKLTGAEQQAKASGAKKRKERLFKDPSKNNPIKNIAELERTENAAQIRKNTQVKFILNGKVVVGKVLHAGAYNEKGEPLKNKKATHFKIIYNTGEGTAKKVGIVKEITLPADKVEKFGKTYVRKNKGEIAEQKEARRKDAEERTLTEAKKRLGARSDADFQKKVLDIMAGEHGLESSQNPINRFLERKVERIVGDWGAKGTMQTMRGPDGKIYAQDLSHADLMNAARVGVFNAVLNYDPKKGKLIQFIGSDSTEHYVKEALKNALYVERGQIHSMDQEGRTLIAHLKHLNERFIMLNENRKPTQAELIEDFKHQFPDKYEALQKRKSYNLPDLIHLMNTSKVANYVQSSTEDGGEVDLIEQAHSPFKGPEEVAIEKVHMSEFRKNLHDTLKDSYEKSGHKTPDQRAALAAHAMQLRHRVDESTTGMGTFGEESPYYHAAPVQAKEYEKKFKGKETTGKDAGLRSYKEIGSMLGKKPDAIQSLIEDAQQRVRDQYKVGHQSATKLFNQFFRKSFTQTSDEIKSYMLKSLFPEKRDIHAEQQWNKAHQMARSIFLAA